ncbi:MAG: hypothetical protein PHW46_01625 [Candidatus Omnitrophica bacterium]|nr:hypothetical protein [Candidatus Omnitrophota bacterium]
MRDERRLGFGVWVSWFVTLLSFPRQGEHEEAFSGNPKNVVAGLVPAQ